MRKKLLDQEFTTGVKNHNRKKIISSTNGAGKNGYSHSKE